MAWDKSRLKRVVKEKLGDSRFFVVSNREPYMHIYTEAGIKCISPASGMSSAIQPIMNACGGTWIANGGGDADKDVVDSLNHVLVPPDDPKYILRRVFLSKEEEKGYYLGYANEGIWPLCHIVYVRPVFREQDWQYYKLVNQKFADAVIEEMGDESGFVFIQDYHFALLPLMIKEKRPDIKVAQFWHIPWPNREAFRVCPHGTEILEGLLGNDILGFHIRYHSMNFIDTVERSIEALIDHERLSIVKNNKETLIRDFPISLDFDNISRISSSNPIKSNMEKIHQDQRLHNKVVAVGIDRIDYTKGIVEKFKAVDRFLELYPEYVQKFILLQMGPISRILVPPYKNYNDEVYHSMTEINSKWKNKGWEPIVLHKTHLNSEEVLSYYKIANVCIVSSLHDGMNLVAKEFIAAREDERGVLILSRFTGAARELTDALLINPLDTENFAKTIYTAIQMSEEEQQFRMQKLREHLENNNIYGWAGQIIQTMRSLI